MVSASQTPQQSSTHELGAIIDERPGAYYVSVRDGERFGLLTGPFATHAEALAAVRATRVVAQAKDVKSAFYAFGTARLELGAPNLPPRAGLLNDFVPGLRGAWAPDGHWYATMVVTS